jgi:sulfur carrier protein ThiS
MITVNVRVYSALNYYVKKQDNHRWFKFAITDGSTVAQLIAELNIPESEVMIIRVNGEICNNKQILDEGDSIELYPWLAGG